MLQNKNVYVILATNQAISFVFWFVVCGRSDTCVQCQLQIHVGCIKTDANVQPFSQADRRWKLPDGPSHLAVAKKVHIQGEVPAANSRIARMEAFDDPIAVLNGGVT